MPDHQPRILDPALEEELEAYRQMVANRPIEELYKYEARRTAGPVSETLTQARHAMKLPLRLKLLFSTGDLSTSIPLAILMFFQLYFMTDVAGLRPDLAGWAVGIGKLWDAVNDPLVGLLSRPHPQPLWAPAGDAAAWERCRWA